MRRSAGFILCLLALTAAAPESLSRFKGVTLSQAVNDLGTPTNMFDGTGGVRHFEWSTTDVLVLPEMEYDGNPAWWTSPKPIAGVPWNAACKLVLTGRWQPVRGAWIVERVKPASQRCRGMRDVTPD